MVAQTRPKGGCQTAMPRRWIQDRNPSPQVQLILRRYIKCQNVSRRGSLNWKQLLLLATEWRSRNVQIAVAWTHYLWEVDDTPAGKPPTEMNICNTSDNLQIEMSATLVKMADGSPPEVNILTDSDTLQTELSVMTVTSERWMERFIMNKCYVWTV